MSLQPSEKGVHILEGDFTFSAIHEEHPQVSDSYRLRIIIPEEYPRDLPSVIELGMRIPRLADFHVNGDGTLCLGSRLSLMARVQTEPTITGFANKCIVPYLYAMTLKLNHKVGFVFGELQHGVRGEIYDYKDLLGLDEQSQVIPALLCILKKKRIANKLPCPCQCGKRLGKCRYNATIRNLRKLFPKAWLRKYVIEK